MTKEENISTLNEHLEHWKRLLSEKICDQSEGEKTIDALQNAIKALEQEPCEDVVRRPAVNGLQKYRYNCGDTAITCVSLNSINELQSVTQQPKMGRWILLYECANSGYYCSECQKKVVKEGWSDTVKKIKYCPNCGAKIQEAEG